MTENLATPSVLAKVPLSRHDPRRGGAEADERARALAARRAAGLPLTQNTFTAGVRPRARQLGCIAIAYILRCSVTKGPTHPFPPSQASPAPSIHFSLHSAPYITTMCIKRREPEMRRGGAGICHVKQDPRPAPRTPLKLQVGCTSLSLSPQNTRSNLFAPKWTLSNETQCGNGARTHTRARNK